MKVKLTNPVLDKGKVFRMIRGVAWHEGTWRTLASDRDNDFSDIRNPIFGFRLVRNK